MSSEKQEHSKTIDLATLFPPLRTYWPHTPERNPRQAAFLLLPQLDVFYGGAAGGAKSESLLAAALEYVDVPRYAAILFRRSYTDLSLPGALMDRAQQWLRSTDARWNDRDKTWAFPSGATLTFGYLDNDNDVYRYQSAEFQYVGFDELTQFSERQFRYLFSRLRKPDDLGEDESLAGVPLRMRAASNPGGIGHNWVKKRYIEGRKPGRIFIPAKLSDNPHVNQDSYRRSLAELPDVLVQQLLDGDWGAFEGAAYPEFSEAVHVVEPFTVPLEWERFECMDFGSTNPTAWYACAVDHDGNIAVFDEYYSPGLVSDHAPAILERRREHGWQVPGITNVVYADPSVKNKLPTRTAHGVTSVEAEFAEYGITLSHANNDRQAGYLRLAELLKPDPNRYPPSWSRLSLGQPSPQLFIFRHCTNLIEQLGVAPIEDTGPLTGEAVAAAWEREHGHGHAGLRYGVLSRPGRSEVPEKLPETEEELRGDFFGRYLERLEEEADAKVYG